MAVTQVNLSDQMAIFVKKTNIISGDLGDVAALTTAADSNAVVAINELDAGKLNLAGGTMTGNLLHGDNVKAIFGDDSDLVIVHSGGTNLITGNIDLTGNLDIAGRITTDAITENVSGNVGIGTSSPASLLHLDQGSGGEGLRFERNSYDTMDIELSESGFRIRNETDGRTDFFISGSGNVGIGTSSPSSLLTAEKDFGNNSGSSAVALQIGNISTVTGQTPGTRLLFNSGNRESGAIDVDHNTVGGDDASMNFVVRDGVNTMRERMRIGSDGRIYLNTTTNFVGQSNTSTGQMFQPEGTAYFSRASGYSLGLNRNGDGELTNFSRQGVFKGSINVSTSGVTYNTTSDERLKENIETLQNGTELLKAMRAVTYDWKADGNSDTGFIAQEMNEVMPQAVSEGDDGMLSMDYGRVTPIIVAALQDALKRIDELEAKQCNCGGCS